MTDSIIGNMFVRRHADGQAVCTYFIYIVSVALIVLKLKSFTQKMYKMMPISDT